MNIKELSFEQAFSMLEELSSKLESGKLPLEELLSTYEQCRQLLDYCNMLLNNAEQRISLIKKNEDGSPEEVTFVVE